MIHDFELSNGRDINWNGDVYDWQRLKSKTATLAYTDEVFKSICRHSSTFNIHITLFICLMTAVVPSNTWNNARLFHHLSAEMFQLQVGDTWHFGFGSVQSSDTEDCLNSGD